MGNSKKSLKSLFHDKRIYLVGSAPQISHELHQEDMTIVCVNGSLGNLSGIASKCDLLLVDNELLNPLTSSKKENRAVIIRNNILSNYSAEYIVSSSSNGDPGGSPTNLGLPFGKYISLSREKRLNIVRALTGESLLDHSITSLLSTGGFAIALSFFLGAKQVFFSGFGLNQEHGAEDPPHFYSEIGAKTKIESIIVDKYALTGRNHSLADSYLISRLTLKGFQLHTSNKEYFHLLSNWGYKSILNG